jgi:hypothetical protein
MRFECPGIWLLCAWVLWVEYQFIGPPRTIYERHSYERKWQLESAYPDDGYAQCIQDMQTLASRAVESSRGLPNVKSVEKRTLIGQQESIHTELKSGGSQWKKYVCLPDTVKPE